MAIPFLSNIDLNKKQALNLVLHNKNAAPSSPADGQMYFNSDGAVMKAYVYLGSSKGWTNIGGDIEGVDITAGSGLTGTVATTSGTHTQTIAIGTGDGITVSADKISVTVDDTTIGLSASDNSGAVIVKDNGIDLAQLKHQTADTVLKMNGSGVPTAGTIDTANVTDDAITYAKIQNVSATNRILGRDSANAGIIEEITPANVRTMLNVEDGANNYSLDLTKLNAVTSVMDSDDTLTFGDSDNDTQVTIKGNLTVVGKTTTNNVETVSTSSGVIFEGTAADGNDATLVSVVAGSSKTYTLPNITGHIPILTNNPGTTAVSATVDEINTLDGFTGNHHDLNYAKDLRATGVSVIEYDTLDGITASTTELNVMDGDTSATSTSLVDADRVVVNDNGTMKQVAFSDVATYINAQITSRELTVELDANESVVTKSGNVYTVTHNFGTRSVLCQVIEDNSNSTDGSYQTVMVDVDRVSDSAVEVDFGQSVTDGHYRILIHKIG
tara:strand:+ start:402 stop:1895 length:1494 start_codon:yes stop_codon:yes gene_type:complete